MQVIIDGQKYVPANNAPTGNKLLAALEIRFDSDAGDDLTVRQWLSQLLSMVWEEEESFSGKRPWGNSGWQFPLHQALARAGFFEYGPCDDEGDYYNPSREQIQHAHHFVHDLILAAFFGVTDEPSSN